MTLQNFCDRLPDDKKNQLALRLAKRTIPIWNNYADKHKLSYRDSIVGLKHTVERTLLEETLNEIGISSFTKTEPLSDLYNKFIDPIVALQDDDWKLPNEVEKTFYCIYNLLVFVIEEKQNGSSYSPIYVSINQAIEALETSETLTEEEIKKLLSEM
jgi:hypothetical protein